MKKRSDLARYYQNGWLRFGSKYVTQVDSLRAGTQFANDFSLANIMMSGCIDYEKPRVDCSIGNLPDVVLDARDRYGKAIRLLSKSQHNILKNICCMDKEIKFQYYEDKASYIHNLEILKETLCRGLDTLAEHYYGKPELKRKGIVGCCEKKLFDDVEN